MSSQVTDHKCKVIAYIRSATTNGNLSTQRSQLLTLASKIGVEIDHFIELDGIGGVGKWSRRRLDFLLDQLSTGDLVLVSDISRLSRNTADLLTIIESITRKGAQIITSEGPH